MFKIILLTIFLLFGVATPAQGDWYIVLEDSLQEPTLDKLIEWVPEEVPRTVSFYFDTDGDGMFDLKIAYSLIEAFACKENCVRRIIDNGDHWILPAPGVNYFVIKKWIVYRYFGDEDWRGVEKTNQWIFKYH
jgi:hypothetical protein